MILYMYIKLMRRYASMVNEIDFIGKTVEFLEEGLEFVSELASVIQ